MRLTRARYALPARRAAGKFRKLDIMERKQQGVPARNLRELRSWAQERIREGGNAAWSHYQHMKLIEAIDAILSSDDDASSEASLRVVDDGGDPRHADWPVHVLS